MDRSQIDFFLTDPEFVQLARRRPEDPEWRAYELAHADRKAALYQARMILLASDRFPEQTLEENRKKALWDKIEDELEYSAEKGGFVRSIRSRSWWAAAVVILGFGLLWLANPSRQRPASKDSLPLAGREEAGWKEITNTKDAVFPVDLPDGSTVLLKKDSRVRFAPGTFAADGKRELHLDGEAFFEVVPNPDAPFYVYTNELVTKVLGTSFNIKAFPDASEVEVAVKTGRVTVFRSRDAAVSGTAKDPEGEILHPDQRITLNRNSGAMVLEELASAGGPPEPGLFIFDDKSVSDVFKTLEAHYGVKIIYPESLLRDCRITAAVADETLYEKIRLICKGLNATYQVVDGDIVISSEGCTY